MQERAFPEYSALELAEGVRKTLEALEAYGWTRKRTEGKRWSADVRNRLLPSNLLDLFSGAYHNVLTIEVSGNAVKATCEEETKGYVMDWQGGKKRVLEEFFSHLESMLASDVLDKEAFERRHGLIKRFVIGILLAMAAGAVLAFLSML